MLERIRSRAAADPQRIVLPEAEEPRVLAAAAVCVREQMARIIALGQEEKIRAVAREIGADLRSVKIVDYRKSGDFERMVTLYQKLQCKKNIKPDEARSIVADPLYYANLMVRLGRADGCVAGVVHTTADTVRAALRCIGMRRGSKHVSSFFAMVFKDQSLGHEGTIIYADCALVVDPSIDELAEIAIATAESARFLLQTEPRVAILSFSCKDHVSDPLTSKIAAAARLVRASGLVSLIEGAIGADLALTPQLAQIDTSDSILGGRANVLIFPNLNAANIAQKLTERLAGATAVGAIMQGLNKPSNDLSRGSQTSDIINIIAVTGIQAQSRKAFNKSRLADTGFRNRRRK